MKQLPPSPQLADFDRHPTTSSSTMLSRRHDQRRPAAEACRGKRKRSPRLFDFRTFPASFRGAFRDSVREFLRQCVERDDDAALPAPVWCTLLARHPDSRLLPLYTVEESAASSPTTPFCHLCRSSGWSNHFVSKRKYHFIIPADREWNYPLQEDALDDQTHLLHGLIHCNGFGHLICINGKEGGSGVLCGREIMDLWDRICTRLQVRKITVEDVAKKRGMNVRLLHGIAYGHSWFGRWGYRFHRGSFGVTVNDYDTAVEVLSSIELDSIINDFSDCSKIKRVIYHYRYLSEAQLLTVRDLLRFMLTLKAAAPQVKRSPSTDSSSCIRHAARTAVRFRNASKAKPAGIKSFSSFAQMDSRWPASRLEYTAQVVVDALRQKKEEAGRKNGGGMTRQDLRDAARRHIGDTGLLDYALKSMNNVIVGNYVVRRAVNPNTRILEYNIREIDGCEQCQPEEQCRDLDGSGDTAKSADREPGSDVYHDVQILYTNVLREYPGSETLHMAAQTVLHGKIFAKEWPIEDGDDDQDLRFVCQVKLCDDSGRRSQPGELVEMPLFCTIGDLKLAAQTALRDTYCALERFVVTEIGGMEDMADEEIIFGAAESSSQVMLGGDGADLDSGLTYEGGSDNWKVKCRCGAADDDGERMISCDMCEVWQHTRCLGIDDAEAVPSLFLCQECSSPLLTPKSDLGFRFEHPDPLLLHSGPDGWQFEQHSFQQCS
uniref:PHD-type domain-containing protein n=3 Tax=Kalanchoe fedtschenkoi TaxID=63787 RepID=A0A7N0UKI6_KALFE